MKGELSIVTLPRSIEPGDVVLGTRRCSERRFFLRPDPETCQVFEYCLARCANKYGIELHEFVVMSNHYHLVFTDPHGNRPEFFRDLNKQVASAVNVKLKRFENMFAPGSYNAPKLLEAGDIEAKCIYTLTNPTEAGLVKAPRYWEGVSSWGMEYGETRLIERPEVYFRDCMPTTVELRLTRPVDLYPELDDRAARQRLRQRAEQKAYELAESIRSNGGGFLGMKRVLRQPWDSAPYTRARRFGIKPNVAGKNKWARIEALQVLKSFLTRYVEARLAWVSGMREVEFPPGTYLMARRFGVTVAPVFN